MNWKEVQKQSDRILSDGLYILTQQPYFNLLDVQEDAKGNYLISLDKAPYYIGEAKQLSKRLRQQCRPTTSTFYKNYLKSVSTLMTRTISIEKFKVQFMRTNIGRKEIEESGIVNLSCRLNKFQLDKRMPFPLGQYDLWTKVQESSDKLLREAEIEIMAGSFTSWSKLIPDSCAGLYVVKDSNDKLIYIGESSDICDRIGTHSRQTYFSALRRHIGTEILGFKLQERNGKKRYFSDMEDEKVSNYLRNCKAIVYPVNFGRYELEEFLIKKYRPLLNRKDNRDI